MPRPKKNNGPPGSFGKSKDGKDGKSASGGGGGKERKKGFQVGPAHAAKNAYLGKAQKIKADLIMRSKLKKSYAKVVQEEGVQSNRLKPRTGAAGTSAAAAEASSEAGPSSSRSTEGGEREKGGRAGSLKRKFSGQGETGRPSKFRREKGTGEAGDDDVLNRTESANSTKRKVRALSPGDIGPPMPQSSLIELKKEAFAKYHSPHSRSTSATTGVGRGGGRSVSGGSTRSTGSSGLFGGGGGGKKGQPNMGARMGLLLEKIKRDRA